MRNQLILDSYIVYSYKNTGENGHDWSKDGTDLDDDGLLWPSINDHDHKIMSNFKDILDTITGKNNQDR